MKIKVFLAITIINGKAEVNQIYFTETEITK